MFKRTVSFLKGLVGGKEERPEESQSEERRVRVRYPSNVQINFQAVNGSTGPRLSARVRNISLGGVSLVAERRLEPGTMLSVELPADEGGATSTVLACVVHATEHGGEWALGCTFSHELNNDDLRPFGAKREKPAAPDDARNWVRFPCDVTAVCQEVASPKQEPWPVQVLNVSSSGIGLLASRSIEPGTLLNLELHRGAGNGHTLLACVVHVTPQDGGRLGLGCNFIRELTEDEMKTLL